MNIHYDKEPQLLQLRYKSEPWKMMVACILLNRTPSALVDLTIDGLFVEYPDVESLAHARAADIVDLLRPLGLQRVRAIRLIRFAGDFASGTPIEQCYAISDYAYESYRLFVLNDFTFTPSDKDLCAWLAWRTS
jgi:methyl-CpG-binding domain protein 4